MILVRRGHPLQSVGSTGQVDVTIELGPAFTAPRYERFAPWRPPIEVFETASELVVRAELAGLTPGEVEVLVSGEELVIRGQRTIVPPPCSRRYHESRVRYGPFEAAVHLPFAVAVESATADYIDGFLSVTLPRMTATRVTMRENGRPIEALRGDQ